MARVSPHGRGLGVATVIHHTISGDTIQMPPVVWGEGWGSQFVKQPASANGALLLFTDRPALFTGAGRLTVAESFTLATCIDAGKIL